MMGAVLSDRNRLSVLSKLCFGLVSKRWRTKDNAAISFITPIVGEFFFSRYCMTKSRI